MIPSLNWKVILGAINNNDFDMFKNFHTRIQANIETVAIPSYITTDYRWLIMLSYYHKVYVYVQGKKIYICKQNISVEWKFS